jgi:hypothetical protein
MYFIENTKCLWISIHASSASIDIAMSSINSKRDFFLTFDDKTLIWINAALWLITKNYITKTNETMQQKNLLKAVFLVLLLVAAFTFSWEMMWRSRGFEPTFNDDKVLWAAKRKDVYKPQNEATVFIGSSRIKFDLDIPTWRNYTGEDAVQLSIVGTSPRLLLQDLANDENFKGKLVVDITEVLFYSQNPGFHKSAKDAIAYYKNQTPTQKLSSAINFSLESDLVFLEERKFALNALFNDLYLPNRAGVFVLPPFPKGFELTTQDRQTYMSDSFLADTNAINWQTGIWKGMILGDKTPPVNGDALSQIFDEVYTAVNKIRSRGGKIIFIRTPSSHMFAEAESAGFPREIYWDKLLAITKADGIHFKDYDETKDLLCPEWSHLSREQAVDYTLHLVKVLQNKEWFAGHNS